MATINEKIKLTLDECRMLVLGTQVLISLQFNVAFQPNFAQAPDFTQKLAVAGLALLLGSFALLLFGPAYHRITQDAHPHPAVQTFMIKTMLCALLPTAAALGIDAYIVLDIIWGPLVGCILGTGVFCFCCSAWYGLGFIGRRNRAPEVIKAMKEMSTDREGKDSLHDRVMQVMTEARVVLPGAQAMLGFEFITFFTQAFADLPDYVKVVHVICTGLIALTAVMLMTPAAFHRIADAGEDSERIVKVAGRCVVGAMLPLAIAMAGDFFVIVVKVTHSGYAATAAGCVALAVFVVLWFGYTLFRRERPASRRQVASIPL